MALAVNIMHGYSPSDEMRDQLQPKKTKVRLHQPLIMQHKASYVLYIANKMDHCPCHRYNVWAWPE